MRRLPPLIQLRAFEAAARHGSFKAAAEELGVTPSAISHQIGLLEAHCGQPLFRRQPRPIALTDAGAAIFPAIAEGFDRIAHGLGALGPIGVPQPLRLTATNAFAARCLVPQLAAFQAANPHGRLEIIGTDAVLDLDAGEADVAIRYARVPPTPAAVELARDRFFAVASPSLVGSGPDELSPARIAKLPLIETGWPRTDADAPTWRRWQAAARADFPDLPHRSELPRLHFQEELHAIDAVIGGRGIGLCSDLLVRRELQAGTLVRVSAVSLPGYGFYFVHRPDHPRMAAIAAVRAWMATVVAADA